MYPEILIGDGRIYTFGVFLSLSILLFFWMLRKVTRDIDGTRGFFFNHLLLYFLSTFFFARLFHVIFYWGLPGKSSFSISHPILSFVTMSDFYFSLAGALLGFLLVLTWVLKNKEEGEKRKAYDATWIAFLFAAFF